MNALKIENKLPFQMFAVHAEGESEKANALMDTTDIKGRPWKLDFVYGTKELNERLAVKGYPSYYVIDDQARPVAVVLGHPEGTIDLLEWLIIEARKRS